eukprot:g4959.t1 g4959   contig18:320460-321366(-)
MASQTIPKGSFVIEKPNVPIPLPKTLANQDVCDDLARDRAEPSFAKRTLVREAGVEFDMVVYDKTDGVSDIVSNQIIRSKTWEARDVQKVMSLFPCKVEGESECTYSQRQGAFLDIGANIGFYSLVAAHLGHKVISFEPFRKNIDLMCMSREYLLEPKKSNFHLHGHGLDYKPRQCQLFQDESRNIGDTHSICDEQTLNLFLSEKSQYKSLGWMNTTTLDDALNNGMFDSIDGGIDVMKMDVEGFEPNVIAGGNAFLSLDWLHGTYSWKWCRT